MKVLALTCLSIAMLSACGGTPAPTPTVPTATSATAGTTATPHPANALLVDVASCWFGGIWGDAEGQTPAEREASSTRRCEAVVRTVWGKEDHPRLLQLRALESVTLAEVGSKLAGMADSSADDAPNKDVLLKLYNALAAERQEAMVARRAAKRIARDLEREPEKLNNDEAAALPELEKATAYDALVHVEAGALQQQVHALALFALLDRMNTAHELPVHMKPYVVAAPYKTIFGAALPDVPHDASKPLARGGWLTYLTSVASAAGHPVTRTDTTPQIRHELAVAGILAGVVDKLKADAEHITPEVPLSREVQLVIRGLEAEVKKAQAQ
ncbi:MAG TPA: hypothetical protein VF316_08685 [Polyangiaceae bacterium]